MLDVGCGEGALAQRAAGRSTILGMDGSATLVRAAATHGPVARADVAALPCADRSVDAVVAVHVFDHLLDPLAGLRESRRVLRPGGLLIVATTSRSDSPELAPQWRPAPGTFDAEDAPSLFGELFAQLHTEFWDAPLVTLPDRDALCDYLRARFEPPAAAAAGADAIADQARRPHLGALLIVEQVSVSQVAGTLLDDQQHRAVRPTLAA